MLMLSLLCGLVLLCSVRAQGQCPSLKSAAGSSVHPSCSAYSDCTGLSCSNSDLNWTVSLVVQQCTDPVVVVVNVTVANGTRVGFVFTEQGQQQQGGVVVVLGRQRNASHILVEVNSSSSDRLIPPLYVPLNPDECMCRSVQAIVLRTQQQPAVTCTQNFNCTGVTCQPSVFIVFGGTIEGDIRPCTDPPSFEVSISGPNKQLLFRRSFTHSELANITIPGLPPKLGLSSVKLNVTLIERPYSEIVQVDLIALSTVIPIIRRQQVILDKSGCAPPTAPPTSPPRSPITTATCSKLEQISQTVNILECTVKDGCAGLTCNDDNHRLDMTLLPCNSPPGLNVKVYNSSNVLIYNANITNDTTFNVDSQVRVRMQVLEVPGGIRVKAYVLPGITVLPYTNIPLDRCQCSNVVCIASTSILLPPAPPTPVPPAPTSPTPHTSSSLTTVLAISIPITVIMVAAIVLVIAVVVFMFVRHQLRSRRRFTFQQMSIINKEEDYNDDNDNSDD